jgi:SAM-dependent methyltransferase
MNLSAERKCEACEGTLVPWAEVRGYTHARCRGCRSLFVTTRVDEAELDAYYADPSFHEKAEAMVASLEVEWRRRLALIEDLASARGLERRLLDVGCANGDFLRLAHASGWKVVGQDRSPALAARARAQGPFPVWDGVLSAAPVAGGPFPIVTAWEVLEHATSPRAFFGALANQVAPGGFLAISTPMATGLPARIMGARFPMIVPPEHLSVLSRRGLEALASRHRFRVAHFSSFSLLTSDGLARGLSRTIAGRALESLPAAARAALVLAARAAAWVPALVDRIGLGSEMLVILSGEETPR